MTVRTARRGRAQNLAQQVDLRGVHVRKRHFFRRIAVEVHDTVVGEARNEQPREPSQRRLQVQRRAEQLTSFGQEFQVSLASFQPFFARPHVFGRGTGYP